jgi:HD-GYP domain-containing protein (c-di-GMP phosphodiesterase class II)
LSYQRTFIITTAVTCVILAVVLGTIVTAQLESRLIREVSNSSAEVLKNHTNLLQLNPNSVETQSAEMLSTLSGLTDVIHVRAYSPQGKLLWTGPEKISEESLQNDEDINMVLRGSQSVHLLYDRDVTKHYIPKISSHVIKITIPIKSPNGVIQGILVAYQDIGFIYQDIHKAQVSIWAVTAGVFGMFFLFLIFFANQYSREVISKTASLQNEKEQLEKSYRESLQILASAVESRAPYSAGHSQRVALYAAEVAKRLSLSTEQIERVRYTCLLQNIGLVRIPDAVLLKEGTLEAKEMTQLRRHPSDGAELLKRSSTLIELAAAVKAHHERMDGTGYPEGLVGEQIPLEARIVAVADAYVAMTTDRPYRKALTREQAISEIRKHAGTQFDLRIVDMVVQVVQETADRRSGQERRLNDWGPKEGDDRREMDDRREI